jgi:serine/threonine protein kinase
MYTHVVLVKSCNTHIHTPTHTCSHTHTRAHTQDAYESDAELFIVMEHCRGGDLFEHISVRKQYSERDAAKLIKQVLEGVKVQILA